MKPVTTAIAVASLTLGAAMLIGCASTSPTTEPSAAAQPAAGRLNGVSVVMPYNGGVYDMNGPYQNSGNNDLPDNSR